MKFSFWSCVFFILLCCSVEKKKKSADDFLAGQKVGELTAKELEEASGLVASVVNPGLFWTINDSENSADVFLVDQSMDIKLICNLSAVANRDWEDVTIGYDPKTKKNYLYVADIGDNEARYRYKMIYRFIEPTLADSSLLTILPEQIQHIVLRLPDGPKDSEAIMIDPLTHDLFIISKRENPAHVYRLAYPQSMSDTLVGEPVLTLPFGQVTAANFSQNGKEVLIKNYDSVFYWSRDSTMSVVEMLRVKPKVLRYIPEPQGESITWSLDGSGYYTVSEKVMGRRSDLLFYKRK